MSAPAVLPRDTPLLNYSPLVVIQYDGLAAATYKVVVHLLETQTGTFQCGCQHNISTMWCPATFTIDNQSGSNSSGLIRDARLTNVHNLSGFQWKVELQNESQSVTYSTAIQNAGAAFPDRAPVLGAIGNKNAVVGQSLDFTVSASDPEANAFTLSAVNLPAGATFDGATGQFHWQPSAPGTYPRIGFVVTQDGATPLSDAELITIEVVSAPPAGVISFGTASYTAGEGGPAVLTLTRNGGSAGAASVSYSTGNGSALAGTDYTGVSDGTVTFSEGETAETIRVSMINDSTVDANETFNVTLSAPAGGAVLGAPSQATVTIVDDDNPQAAGQWGGVQTWPTVPIHVHLLPTGKVMFWDRHNHNATPAWDVTPRLWDPASPAEFTTLPLPGWDIFCSGHTLMADGRLFVAGGHIDNFVGTNTAGIYNPFANTWTALPNMNAGRWYPTTTTLASGDVLVVAGTKAGYQDINHISQVWQINSGAWRALTNASSGPLPVWPDYYPYMYQAANGKVFVAGPQQTARYLDTAGTGQWTDVAASGLSYRDYGSSVMYDDGKVLIVGGNPRDVNENIPINLPSNTAEVIDLNAATPAWRAVTPMSAGRRHLNATLLPDGKVLVTGGSAAAGHDDPAGKVLFAEMWDPATEQWTPLAAHARYRGYHSNALLLPDGRVLVAGGGHPDPPGGGAENNAEVYSPPYLFKGARPLITSAPAVVTYAQTFFVQTPDAAGITNINWIRLGSVTHAFNESQRLNRLGFSQTPGGLSVTAPANANLCPPGHYMLFILNGNGVPSVARIVQILDPASLRIDAVTPKAGRASGGQQVVLAGSFANLSAVKFGGGAAIWSYTNGTGEITVTVPAHAVGAVNIELASAVGNIHFKGNAFAYLPTVFTDNALAAGVTTAKAQHIIELRQAVEALRAVAGLAPAPWTDAALSPTSTIIRAVHVAELRTHLDDAATRLGYGTAPYTDPMLSPGLPVKRAHIEELRQRIRSIAG